jgi:hypothetical protein
MTVKWQRTTPAMQSTTTVSADVNDTANTLHRLHYYHLSLSLNLALIGQACDALRMPKPNTSQEDDMGYA